MKYLKLFEQKCVAINEWFDEPNVGDYVFCDEEDENFDRDDPDNERLIPLLNFISSHIGKYIHDLEYEPVYKYVIQYENVPEELERYFIQDSADLKVDYCRRFTRGEILLCNKSKEKLEIQIQARKYNL